MNGREVHSVENTNPKAFTNVRVFAGDKSRPAADASYRNLSWKNFYVDHSFNVGTKILKNKEIGTIDIWGPFFRVSFDLIIHSLNRGVVFSSLLAFRGNGATCNKCELGDRIPALWLKNNGFMQISNNVNDLHEGILFKIKLNHWYKFIIEQKYAKKEVRK